MTEPYALHQGDCLEILRELPDCSVDSVVCDPPYGLSKEPDMAEVLRHWLAGDDYQHKGGGFMGKTWDSFVPGPAIWRECLRVLKPGGHLLAFFGTRTQDIGTLAIRLAGFEIRDSIAWVYGSGFPKSHNLEGDWEGWGTALKPALEPITVARKPLAKGKTIAANVLAHGTGALNIDGCRVAPTGESRERLGEASQERRYTESGSTNFAAMPGVRGGCPDGRWPANLIHDGSDEVVALFPAEAGAAAPVHRRNGDKFRNSYGTFGGDIDEAGSTFQGDSGSAARFFYCAKASRKDRNEGLTDPGPQLQHGTTLRKVENTTTTGNHHPTVKPTDLMAYLCRLVTPPGGVVLDPFMGSGSTGKAAVREGFRFIGCERDEGGSGQPLGYMPIAEARINFEWQRTKAQAQAAESAVSSAQLDIFSDSAT